MSVHDPLQRPPRDGQPPGGPDLLSLRHRLCHRGRRARRPGRGSVAASRPGFPGRRKRAAARRTRPRLSPGCRRSVIARVPGLDVPARLDRLRPARGESTDRGAHLRRHTTRVGRACQAPGRDRSFSTGGCRGVGLPAQALYWGPTRGPRFGCHPGALERPPPRPCGRARGRHGRGPRPTPREGTPARGVVERARFMGSESLVEFRMDFDGSVLKALVPSVFLPKPGTPLWLMIRRDRCFVFPRPAKG